MFVSSSLQSITKRGFAILRLTVVTFFLTVVVAAMTLTIVEESTSYHG